MTRAGAGPALLGLFVVSGFAGLIYQSIWSHYLGLTLGHAAYAQTLVLAIFMGGMALGAWLASRWGGRWRDLVLAYALVEAVIGLAGLGFHPLFLGYTALSQQTVLPMLSGAGVAAWQWLGATALILPQCVLLGATFPLLSAGWLRLAPAQAGRVLGGLYFANSFGAALGVLAATFLLLPRIGMPGAVQLAGGLNLAVAAGAAWLAWSLRRAGPGRSAASRGPRDSGGAADGERLEPRPLAPSPAADGLASAASFSRLVLWATALSGAASFVYEIVWVRLLNQALGTTLHAFELMLAAFILGLACGAWWVRGHGGCIADALRYAGIAQVAMGVAALLSTPVFAQSFVWVGWLVGVLPRDDGGYALYNLGSAAIALAVMFPAAFFAGMTLPLFTMALLRRGAGEAAIGRVYAANTLGAIAGVLACVHLLVPLLGLHGALVLAALVDAGLGLVLLRIAGPARLLRPAMTILAALAIAFMFGRPDPLAQLSGVFRTGQARADAEARVAYLRDGKTATVAVAVYPSGAAMIATNGKPDASLTLGLEDAPMPDEITMLMAGALPLALHPAPREVAVIGWGSGLTTHTLLGSPLPVRVESIEIERAMVEGARVFGARVARAYDDPRSVLRIDDARTHFVAGRRRYDAIVSEPSNPWVSGVAHLFTEEFYALLHRHLTEQGVLVQWLQSYEIDDALLARMVTALLTRFPQAEVYLTNDYDLLLVARRDQAPAALDLGRLDHAPLRDELARVGLAGEADYRLRRIGGPRVLATFSRLMGGAGHSDFHPVVALGAPRTRFLGSRSEFLQYLVDNGLPVLDLLDGRAPPARGEAVSQVEPSRFAYAHRIAAEITAGLEGGRVGVWLRERLPDQAAQVERLLARSAAPLDEDEVGAWSADAAAVAKLTLGLLPAADHAQSWVSPRWLSAGQPHLIDELMAAWSAAARRAPAAMFDAAVAVLEARDTRLPVEVREQMLVIAQLGALGLGDADGVALLETRYGDYAPRTRNFDGIRHFLRAWAEG